MQVAIAGRLAPAALIVALVLLAGCGNGGGGVAAGTSTSAHPSTVASKSAMPSASAKPSTSAKPSHASSTVPTQTPTTAASTPRAAQAPSALLDSALSAMLAQPSVHLACTISSSTGDSMESEDIGTASGRSVYTSGDVSISNLLVGGTDYFSTNTAGVLAANGISQAEAEKLAEEWISMRPGDAYGNGYLSYANGIRGMTLASQADALRLPRPLKRTGPVMAQGMDAYGVSGGATAYFGTTKSATETVYIAASGTPLPVSVSANSGNGTVTTCNFSNWDKPVDLTAPPHPVPLMSIPSS
jgi:hypothetical protein